MWTWRQRTGELLRDGKHVAFGYAGKGAGRNNPDLQHVANIGPIPAGNWKIVEMIPETATHGPYVLRLAPRPLTLTYGRSGFLVHGDNRRNDASLGCIILPRAVREAIWTSGDHDLRVEEGEPSTVIA